jgi:N-acetylmuramoyl-L-alanine amidase
VHCQNLALTRTTARPQVLVETAFLTDKGNLRLLMTDDGRQRIANRIAAGVELFYKNQLRR